MKAIERMALFCLIPLAVGFLAAGAGCNPEIVIGSSALFLAITIIATRKVE